MNAIIKDLFSNWKTVPNFLSFLRILMVPAIGVLYYQGHFGWVVFVLFLSGLTDFLDGKIARRFNQISSLGKMLDPIADKLTQIVLAVMLYYTFSTSTDSLIKTFSWIFLIFLIKEVLMVVGAALMIAFGIRPGAAEMPGKIATFVFYAVMLLVIAFGPDIGVLSAYFVLPDIAMIILIAVSAILTVVALLSYLPAVFKQVKERKAEGAKNSK